MHMQRKFISVHDDNHHNFASYLDMLSVTNDMNSPGVK
jgi:hypothetical protein